ncbi:MAG: class I SAM-dependent methyltransferase [Pseudomonadota bacterium]
MYDAVVAWHYAAYRPPLHELIVGEALADLSFSCGLDIGCGTGHSTIALANHCDRVIGVDQSQSMLDQAIRHPKVRYHLGSGEELPLAGSSMDIVTLAGVLSYLDPAKTRSELLRVCCRNAYVLPHDFEVSTEELNLLFGLSAGCKNNEYDHSASFSGSTGMSTVKQVARNIEFGVSNWQATHLLLSNNTRIDALAKKYETLDPFDHVVKKLDETGWSKKLSANIYYTLHQLV